MFKAIYVKGRPIVCLVGRGVTEPSIRQARLDSILKE